MIPIDARGWNITFGDRTTTTRPLKDLQARGVRVATLEELHAQLKQTSQSLDSPQRMTYPIWFKVTAQSLAENVEEPGFIYLFQPTDYEELGTMAQKPSRSNFLIPTTARDSHRLPIVKIGVQDGNPHIFINDSNRLPLHLFVETPNPRGKTTIRFGDFTTVHSIDTQQSRDFFLTGPDARNVFIRIGTIQTAAASLLFTPYPGNSTSPQSFDVAINPFALKQISRL